MKNTFKLFAGVIMPLTLSSPSFNHNGDIPTKYTCQGEDVSPPLNISSAPKGTKSFVLIVDDPDAPKTTWVHWVIYNLPAFATQISEKSSATPLSSMGGLNSWKKIGYGGPCPPTGKHRYFHKLYALDIVLPNLGNPTKEKLVKAMNGHILEETALVGLYEKKL